MRFNIYMFLARTHATLTSNVIRIKKVYLDHTKKKKKKWLFFFFTFFLVSFSFFYSLDFPNDGSDFLLLKN